jgi:prolyl oligopeptidase PreP (S9A serine peptidase family)
MSNNIITIKDFMACVNYCITDSSEYCWSCYGNNARYMDYWNEKHGDDSVSMSIIFDTNTQIVYQMEVWDSSSHREYRWLNPDYKKVFLDEANSRNIKPNETIDGRKFIDLDVRVDMLEKASAIFAGREYDTRVSVDIELDDNTMLALMTMAHEADMTLNNFVTYIIEQEIIKQPTK